MYPALLHTVDVFARRGWISDIRGHGSDLIFFLCVTGIARCSGVSCFSCTCIQVDILWMWERRGTGTHGMA